MIVLSLNAGSSSIKFAVINTTTQECITSGLVEKIGSPAILGELKSKRGKQAISLNGNNHRAAIKDVLTTLNKTLELHGETVQAIGHRVVHGGSDFSGPTLVSDHVIQSIDELSELAPLHNPANISVIKAAHELYPELPQVVVFDTAFHQSIPEKAHRYAVPNEWYDKYKVRKYGFHGTSHSFVSRKAINQFELCPNDSNILVAHLGNGASVTAIKGGKSVDTSMGISPLDGLIMGTRSGSVDPSMHLYLQQQSGLSLEAITAILTKDSGMLALSENSSDMRDIWKLYHQGEPKAVLAMEMYIYRLNKVILGQLAAFDSKLDALIFTGGIGENDKEMRSRVLQSLAWIGFKIDPELNQKGGDANGLITSNNTRPLAAVIRTNEELEIAQQTESICR